MSVYVNVDAFGSIFRLKSIQNSVTGYALLDHVMQKMKLKQWNFFGLQGFNLKTQCYLWIDLNKTLIELIQDNFHFDTMLHLQLKFKQFPSSSTMIKQNSNVKRLLYKHFTEWHNKYDLNCPVEVFLFALNFQIEFGNIINYLKCDYRTSIEMMRERSFGGNDRQFSAVLKLWYMFENMSPHNAISNYLQIVANRFQYETVCYRVRKDHTEKSFQTQFNVNFSGITVINKDQPNQYKVLSLPWNVIKKVTICKTKLKITLRKGGKVLKYYTDCEHNSEQLLDLIKKYHNFLLKNKWTNRKEIAVFFITDQDKFVRNMLGSLMYPSVEDNSARDDQLSERVQCQYSTLIDIGKESLDIMYVMLETMQSVRNLYKAGLKPNASKQCLY